MLTKQQKAQIRELLSGVRLRGKERAAAQWWCECLARADLPVWAEWGRFPGPHDITELRARFEDDDPELLEAFEASYAVSCAEFQARCRKPYTPNPAPKRHMFELAAE